MRTTALAGALLAAGLVAGCTADPGADREVRSAAAAAGGAATTAVVLSPTVDPSTSQTVTWRSAQPWSGQLVVARPAEGGPALRAAARRKPATTVRESGSSRPAFVATLRGLRPGTRYLYRIENAGGTLAERAFITPTTDLAPWRFLAFGDTQVDNADRPAAIVRAAVGRFPTAGLVLMAGDVVNHPWEGGEWNDLVRALAPVRTTRNVAVSIGNHEQCILVRSCRSGDAQGFRTFFSAPSNGWPGQHPTRYSFDQQGVRFVVLDAFGSELREQARFLDARLRDDPNRWSVVLLHAGPFASRADRTNDAVRSVLLPVIERHDVDLVLSGHDHVYSSGYRGDPDGTVFATSVSGPTFYDISRADWDRRGATRTRWAERTSTYQVVDVTADTLRYRAIVASKGSGARPATRYGAALDDIVITEQPDGTKTVTRR